MSCGGEKPGGSQPRMTGRCSTGSLAMVAWSRAPTRAPESVAVAAFLDRPAPAALREDDVGRGGDALFGDEEAQCALAGGRQAGEEPAPGQGELHEVDIADEVEAAVAGARVAHRDDGREVPILAAADQGHRRAVPRRLDDPDLDVGGRDRLEALGNGPRDASRAAATHREVGAILAARRRSRAAMSAAACASASRAGSAQSEPTAQTRTG